MIRIGRNTGAEEFPTHAAAFKRFGQIDNFVFVLDGDKRDSDIVNKIHNTTPNVPVFFLPGHQAPEIWIWERLKDNSVDAAAALGINPAYLLEQINRHDAIYDYASDTAAEIAKHKLWGLSEHFNRTSPKVCRVASRLEVGRRGSDIQPLFNDLTDAISEWRRERE